MGKERYERLLYQDIRVGTREELLNSVRALIGNGGTVSTVNPIMLAESVKNPELARALANSLNIPDGFGVSRALSKRGAYTELFPGVELCEALMPCIRSFAVIGGRGGVAEAASEYLCEKSDGAVCLFSQDGYTYDKQNLEQKLRQTAPELVLVCLGSPKQELLIMELQPSSPKSLFIGLGGSLDVYSGAVKRAPAAVRRMHLEWLWRMIKEPRRLRKLPHLVDFVLLANIEKRSKRQKRTRGSVNPHIKSEK